MALSDARAQARVWIHGGGPAPPRGRPRPSTRAIRSGRSPTARHERGRACSAGRNCASTYGTVTSRSCSTRGLSTLGLGRGQGWGVSWNIVTVYYQWAGRWGKVLCV